MRLLIDFAKLPSPKSVFARLHAAHGTAVSVAISLALLNAIKVLAFPVAIMPLLFLMEIYQVSLVCPPPCSNFSQLLYTFLDSKAQDYFINSSVAPLVLLLNNQLAPPHLNSLLTVSFLDLLKANSQHYLIYFHF